MDIREIIFNDIMQNYNKKYKEYNTLEEYNNSAIYLTFYNSYSIIVLPERNLVRSIAQCRFY